MASFRVVADNSGCCAIKHIRDFCSSPKLPSRYIYLYGEGHNDDQTSSQPEAYKNWAEKLDEKPETAGDMFKAIVSQIRYRRPAGMITVNLVEENDYCCDDEDCDYGNRHWDRDQVDEWHPLLTELGFTSVKFMNSNSGNMIHHYTLVYDDGGWN
jgi:hypothetical protein